MKGMYGFLSRSFACLAVTLVILSVLAMPTQGVRANDPSPVTGQADQYTCQISDPFDCQIDNCEDAYHNIAGFCSATCGC